MNSYILKILFQATQRNLTHAHCVFQPWPNYTAGKYNLSVILVHGGGEQIKLNESVPIYYYNSSNLALRNVTPYEILKDDLPENVILVGNGFFDWKETVCYFNSSESKDIIFLNETHLKCKVSVYTGGEGQNAHCFAKGWKSVNLKSLGFTNKEILSFSKDSDQGWSPLIALHIFLLTAIFYII